MFGRQHLRCKESQVLLVMEALLSKTSRVQRSCREPWQRGGLRSDSDHPNHPEVGILGIHKARDMPVARGGLDRDTPHHECLKFVGSSSCGWR